MRRAYALALTGLAFLFALRVAGQALVAFFDVRWLPPMDAWYSGLLPYPILLPTQIVILAVQAWIAFDLTRGRGMFVTRFPRLGPWLVGVSLVYFAAMAVRYVVTMTVFPERRWLGAGTIPIVFHWVLAAYLFVLGRYHTSAR